MPAIRAAGLASVVPVVVLERSADDVSLHAAEGAEITPGTPFCPSDPFRHRRERTVMATTVPTARRRGIPGFAQMQRLGKSLMLPIAVLPAAGILLRLGQPDLLARSTCRSSAPSSRP